jgi:hypothetical protein
MAKVKASGVMTIRQLLAAQGQDGEQRLWSRLSPGAMNEAQNAGATSWISLPTEAEVFEVASELLFPGDLQRLRKLGHAVAKVQFQGIYRIFLLVATVEYLVKRVSRMWDTIYDQGTARVENFTPHGGVLVVEGLPDQLPVQREYICGFLTALIEFTPAKNVRVTKDERDPQVWKWLLRWD